MNILFLSELFYPHGGGAELATYLYAKLLGKSGFNVIVVTNRSAGELGFSKLSNLIVYRLPLFDRLEGAKYLTLLRADVLCSSLLKKLMKWTDIVYVPRMWFSAILLARFYRKPVVTHIHDYIPICPLSNLYDMSKHAICNRQIGVCSPECIYAYERAKQKNLGTVLYSIILNSTLGLCLGKVITLSDAVICVSKAQRNLILMNRPDLVSKTHTIYNPLPEIQQIGVQGNDFGYFGGPNYLKGFHILLRALRYVTHVGHKSLAVKATKFSDVSKRLNEIVSRLGVIVYGKLSNEEYIRLRNQVGTVVVPSVWAEPLPYVITEAMMSGKLVIASRIGGIPEQVDGCKGAFLVDAGDHKQLAEKMLHIKSIGKENLVDLGMKNRESIIKRFNNERIVDSLITMLVKVSNEGTNKS